MPVYSVIPANAGIQVARTLKLQSNHFLDPGLRRDDGLKKSNCRVGTSFVPTRRVDIPRGHKKSCPPYGMLEQ